MSQTKRAMEEDEAQFAEATRIAVRAGALARCDFHPDMVWDAGGDHTQAYMLGNALFTAGELQVSFESRRELTDAIKEAIEQAGIGGCPICDKMLAD